MTMTTQMRNWISDREWQDRLQVAALCRLMALHRMGDATNQIVAVRSSENPNHLITHRLGTFFDEVRASDLLRCDFSGREANTGQQLKFGEIGGLNAGSLNICVPIFQTRPEVNCLIHCHAKPVMVISTLKEGLLPVSQPALFIIPRLGYWPYIFSEGEKFRSDFAQAFAGKQVLIARNHGFYAIGTDAAEAFFLTFYLAQACDAQSAAMACGQELIRIPDEEVMATWQAMKHSKDYHYDGSVEWPGWLRMVDRLAPDYRD